MKYNGSVARARILGRYEVSGQDIVALLTSYQKIGQCKLEKIGF